MILIITSVPNIVQAVLINQPTIISIAEAENSTGHILKGRKLTLNPVNKEIIASTIKTEEEAKKMKTETL